MKVNVPGRGAVEISRVAIVGPVWTDLDMYRETCALLQGTADAAAGDAGAIEFGWLPWSVGTNGQMFRRMVRDLADEYPDGTPCYDGVCMLYGWQSDGAAAFAAAVAGTCGRRCHGAGRVGARPRTGRRGARRGGERAVRTIEYECRRCGKRTAMEPLRYARTVLRDSVRVDGSMHELCPACIRSLHGWFAAGQRKGGE